MEEKIIPRMKQYHLSFDVHKCLCAFLTDQDFTLDDFNEELERFCPKEEKTPRFFNVLGYFTIFKNTANSNDFSKHFDSAKNVINITNESLQLNLSDIEKEFYSYALAIHSFCFDIHYSKLEISDDTPIMKFLEIVPDTREKVWAQFIICSAVVDRLQFSVNTNEDDYYNFSYFVGCLQRSIELRDQFYELKTIHYDNINWRIWYGKEDDGRDPE